MGNLIGFIDYGFLDAAAANALKLPKKRVQPDAAGCVEWLRGLCSGMPGQPPLLRIYWYDAQFDPGDARYAKQRGYLNAIASTPGIELRLGHLRERTPHWHYPLKRALDKLGIPLDELDFHFKPEVSQKGVDTLITLDLVRLAQHDACDTAVLISGDRDLAAPVQAAQDQGCRVLLAVPHGAGMAPELQRQADDVIELDDETLRGMIRVKPEK